MRTDVVSKGVLTELIEVCWRPRGSDNKLIMSAVCREKMMAEGLMGTSAREGRDRYWVANFVPQNAEEMEELSDEAKKAARKARLNAASDPDCLVKDLPQWTFLKANLGIDSYGPRDDQPGLSLGNHAYWIETTHIGLRESADTAALTIQDTPDERDVYAACDIEDGAAGKLRIKSLLVDWDGSRPEDSAMSQAAVKDFLFRMHQALGSKDSSSDPHDHISELCANGAIAVREQSSSYTYTMKLVVVMTEAEMKDMYEGRTPEMDYLEMSDELREEFEGGGMGAVITSEL